MNNRWIKLYTKLADNELLRDAHALQIFIFLLVNADKDGNRRVSKYRTAEALDMNPSTFYKSLKRLEKKYKVLELLGTTKYTQVRLLNWDKYQVTKKDGNHEVTTGELQSNTSTRIESKNKNIYREIAYLSNIPVEDLEELSNAYNCSQVNVKSKADDLHNYCLAKGVTYKNYKAFLRNALKKEFGIRVPIIQAPVEETYKVISAERLVEFQQKKAKLLGGVN